MYVFFTLIDLSHYSVHKNIKYDYKKQVRVKAYNG